VSVRPIFTQPESATAAAGLPASDLAIGIAPQSQKAMKLARLSRSLGTASIIYIDDPLIEVR